MDGEYQIPIEDLYEAYFDCRKNKRGSYNALAFELDYEANLLKLLRDINDGTYNIGRSIAFIVTRPKPREVFAADFRDRIVHHLVIRKIEPLLESYSCRTGKGSLYGFNRLEEKIKAATNGYTEDAYLAKFDCKAFFMSIHKPTLCAMIVSFLEERYNAPDKNIIIRLLRQIILHCPEKNCIRKSPEKMWDLLGQGKSLFTCGDDYGLPIGNLSSQILANFYLASFDLWMDKTFKGLYGRYVDDFFVVAKTKNEILSAIPEMKRRLADVHVTIHPGKMYLQHYTKGISFIGGTLKIGRRYIGKRTAFNFKQCVKSITSTDDNIDCATRALQRVNSYLGFCRHYQTYGLRVRMVKAVTKAYSRWLYSTGNASKLVKRYKYDTQIRPI